jgi:tRNA U55 pseudouridine synthase TruB
MQKELKLFPGSPSVFHPHYSGENGSLIRAIVKFPDGTLREMEALATERSGDFLRDVFAQYTEEEIQANTAREDALRDAHEELAKLAETERKRDEAREALFQAKSQAMEISEVKANPAVGMRIRRAKNLTEVYSLSAMAMIQATETALA